MPDSGVVGKPLIYTESPSVLTLYVVSRVLDNPGCSKVLMVTRIVMHSLGLTER